MTAPAPIPDAELTAARDGVAEAAATVRIAQAQLRLAQEDLEQAILAYRAQGASLAVIGDAAGYSANGIFHLLRRHRAR